MDAPAAFAHCEALVRAADKDRYLSALFAPKQARAGLFALYAFNIEIARVREAVRDALAGEIRLQWWSEALTGAGRGDVAANPVAAALLAAVSRRGLPVAELQQILDARTFDLHDEPMATLADLERYADGVSTSLIRFAMRILGSKSAAQIDAVSIPAGRAHAIVGLLNALPVHAARGRVYVPDEILRRHGASLQSVTAAPATPQLRAALGELRRIVRQYLAQARQSIDTVPLGLMPALLPLAITGPMLETMARPGYDPFKPRDFAQWRRQLLIWRAARQPTRIFS